MATVRSIADHLNISTATVSRVLNSRPGISPETRQRVLDAVKQLGHERAVGLKACRYVGFIHPLGQFAGNLGEYHAAVLGGLGKALGQQQFDLAVIDPFRDKRPDESYTQFFLRKDLRGVVVQVRPHNAHMVQAIADEGFPMIVIASRYEQPNVNWVVVDSGKGYEKVAQHLFDLGHRRIVLATREAPDFDHDERVRGFQEGCRRLGIELDPQLFWITVEDATGGVSVIRRLASMPNRPTAVVFTAPAPTRGALRTCAELGISVPRDLSIVGFDDTRQRLETYPSYTAVCQNAEALGIEAGSLLTRILDGTIDQPVRVVLPAVFEVHQSTGPAPSR